MATSSERPSGSDTRRLAPRAASRKSTVIWPRTSSPRAAKPRSVGHRGPRALPPPNISERISSMSPKPAPGWASPPFHWKRGSCALRPPARPRGGGGAIAALVALLVDLAAIVAGALVLVGQDVVGAGQPLEALLGPLVARIDVGMQLLGELAVGGLQLGLAGPFGNAQHFVEIIAHWSTPRQGRPRWPRLDAPSMIRKEIAPGLWSRTGWPPTGPIEEGRHIRRPSP